MEYILHAWAAVIDDHAVEMAGERFLQTLNSLAAPGQARQKVIAPRPAGWVFCAPRSTVRRRMMRSNVNKFVMPGSERSGVTGPDRWEVVSGRRA